MKPKTGEIIRVRENGVEIKPIKIRRVIKG